MFKQCSDSCDTLLRSSSVLTAVTRDYVKTVCWQLWHVIMFKQCADSCGTWLRSSSVLTAVTRDFVQECADSCDMWLCSGSVLTAVTRDYVQAVCWQLSHVIMFKQCSDSCDTWLRSSSVLTAVTRDYVKTVCWQLWHMIMFKQCADSCGSWLRSSSMLTAVTRDYVQAVCWQLWHVIMFKSVLTAVTRDYVQAVSWQLSHVNMFKQCADSCHTWLCSSSVLTAVTHCKLLVVAAEKSRSVVHLTHPPTPTTRHEIWSAMTSHKSTPNFTNLSHYSPTLVRSWLNSAWAEFCEITPVVSQSKPSTLRNNYFDISPSYTCNSITAQLMLFAGSLPV